MVSVEFFQEFSLFFKKELTRWKKSVECAPFPADAGLQPGRIGCLFFNNETIDSCGFLVFGWYMWPGYFGSYILRRDVKTHTKNWMVLLGFNYFGGIDVEREFWDWTEEFDPGSDWTLAACLTHASRTAAWASAWWRVANGWVKHRNVPFGGG